MNSAGAVPRDLIDAVGEDSNLTPEEKETSIGFTKRDAVARMFTAEAGTSRRLLAHPAASTTSLDVVHTDGARESVSPEEYGSGTITGVLAEVPVGLLKIGRSARKRNGHANILPGISRWGEGE